MTDTTAALMLSLDDYAEQAGISTRTARRWLDANEIPGAGKVRGKWAIPSGAVRQQTAGELVPREASTAPTSIAKALTVGAVLSTLPVFLDLERASHLLGITVYAIRSHPDYFNLVRFGDRGAYVMPKARVIELNGE